MGALIIERDERGLTDKRYLNMGLLGDLLNGEFGDEQEAA